MVKFALISYGNEESYGLLYAGEEFKKYGEIKFFDGEMNDPLQEILLYKPDYLCFSPMTVFFGKAKQLEEVVKKHQQVISVYGGHHATNCNKDCGDITVVGAVHNIDLSKRGRIIGGPTDPVKLKTPAREEYFRDIPRFKNRYRKVMLSMTGCPWSCTYCSSSIHYNFLLKHRNMEDIFAEAQFIKNYTHEIEWVDDDVLYSDKQWLTEFFNRWIKEVNLPMYVSTTSVSALKASPALLRLMKKTVNCVGLGVQAIRPESLKLLGRGWDNEKQIKDAYEYLSYFGFKVNLQCIIGLPISDPVEDGLDTIDGLRRIGAGSIASCYPLQIYPNTAMEKYCKEHYYFLNDNAGDTNSGLPGINFGDKVNNQIKNICKLATMAVKYNIDRKWLESMLDMDLDESSKQMSLVRYYECIKDRLPEKADRIYDSIIGGMNVRY